VRQFEERLRGIERRFKRDPTLKIQYAAFLDEYLSLGHMRCLEPPIAEEPISFYLPHLISILMRFRFFTYVTAHIIKMYRQILVHPSQMRLQKIIWRDDLSANIDTYLLPHLWYSFRVISGHQTGALSIC